ncbi:MAG TPA: hypothetical protein VK751_16670 [Undibacterium sp.]|jgi:hypothetical protein|nr:hypothetical protein [Undibacterium sp.]
MVPATNGVITMSRNDHLGLGQRPRVMVQIRNGKWNYFSEQAIAATTVKCDIGYTFIFTVLHGP